MPRTSSLTTKEIVQLLSAASSPATTTKKKKEPSDPRRSTPKRSLTPGNPGPVPKRLRARSRPPHPVEADLVLVSSSGKRFPTERRYLVAASPYLSDLVHRLACDTEPSDVKDDPVLPEVALEESSETIETLVAFVYPGPASLAPLEFPRDWALLKALDKWRIWRAIDAVHAAFSKSTHTSYLAAPAYAFARKFDFPDLARQVALDVSRSPQPVTDLLNGLMVGVRQLGLDAESVAILRRLTTRGREQMGWLAQRNEHLQVGRQHAVSALVAFDEDYECEPGCRGMVFRRLADAVQTTSRTRVRQVAAEGDMREVPREGSEVPRGVARVRDDARGEETHTMANEVSLEPMSSVRVSTYLIPRLGAIPNSSIQGYPLLIYHFGVHLVLLRSSRFVRLRGRKRSKKRYQQGYQPRERMPRDDDRSTRRPDVPVISPA
ncbi:hypothetical protein JCM10212_006101 [Sporobolomyces blumeae]